MTLEANYEVFPDRAKQIETHGEQLSAALDKAYSEIVNLNSSWKGVRYNKLAQAFYNLTGEFNKIIVDVAHDIPNTLRQIATNYGSFDTSGFSAGTSPEPKLLKEIYVPSDTAIRFEDDAVNASKTTVVRQLGLCREEITKAKNIISSMVSGSEWSGSAATNCLDKVSNYETTINSKVQELENEFDSCIKQAIADKQDVELKNKI